MNDSPVTIDVIKQVKPGCESEFEQTLTDLIAAAEGFDGHLGATVFRSDSEYRIIFKFNHLSNLHQWEASPIRRKLLARANRLTVSPTYDERLDNFHLQSFPHFFLIHIRRYRCNGKYWR